jgi:hypothetical protein
MRVTHTCIEYFIEDVMCGSKCGLTHMFRRERITRVTISYALSNVLYFGIDFGISNTPAWLGVLGDFFSGRETWIEAAQVFDVSLWM